jgi:hypothetical protein
LRGVGAAGARDAGRRTVTRVRVAAILVGVLALLCAASAALGAGARQPDRYTPLVPSVMSTRHWFEGADGRAHLVYELQLVNGFPVPVTVRSVTVLNAANGRRIARYRGPALTAATSLMAVPATPETTIPTSAIGVVWLDIPQRSPRAVPARIEHRVTVRVPPGLPVPRVISMTGGPCSR